MSVDETTSMSFGGMFSKAPKSVKVSSVLY